MVSLVNSIKQIRGIKDINSSKSLSENRSNGNTSSTAKPEENNYKKEKLHMSLTPKILNKLLASQIQQYMKRIIHNDQVKFIPSIQSWFNI